MAKSNSSENSNIFYTEDFLWHVLLLTSSDFFTHFDSTGTIFWTKLFGMALLEIFVTIFRHGIFLIIFYFLFIPSWLVCDVEICHIKSSERYITFISRLYYHCAFLSALELNNIVCSNRIVHFTRLPKRRSMLFRCMSVGMFDCFMCPINA